jgi:hypothetical protein
MAVVVLLVLLVLPVLAVQLVQAVQAAVPRVVTGVHRVPILLVAALQVAMVVMALRAPAVGMEQQ